MDSKFYVSLAAAKLLKEKGYNEMTDCSIDEDGNFCTTQDLLTNGIFHQKVGVLYDKDENGHTRCANCYHNHGGDKCNAVRSYTSYTYIGLVCGKTEQTIESATIIY